MPSNTKNSKPKRRWGDRKDGQLVRNVDGSHFIMPLIFPNRADNEAFISETFDLTNLNKFLEKKNADNPDYKYNLFQVLIAAILKTLTLRPYMNRFVANGSIYQRNEISASFVVKKQFSDKGEEALAIIRANPNDTLETVHEYVKNQVTSCRSDKLDPSMDAINVFNHMPRWLGKAIVRFFCVLDKYGKVPQSLIESDPYYSSVILTNLGSIKLHSGYHHLSNWGTASVFVIVGEKKPRPFRLEDGSVEMRDSVDLGLTVDERIGDGYYFSKTVRLLTKLIENPELLEDTLDTPVEY